MCQCVVDTVFCPYEAVTVPVEILVCVCRFPAHCGDEGIVRAWLNFGVQEWK